MRFRLNCACAALLAAVLTMAVAPVSAKTAESQENSSYSAFASKLKADSEWALAVTAEAAIQAVGQARAVIAQTDKDFAPRFETFRLALNEQKARLGIIGQAAAQRLKAWTEAATTDWNEKWSDSWAHSWAEIHRSASAMLDRLREWIAKQSVSDDQIETPV